MHIVSKPTFENFTVASSHKSEGAATRSAKRLGLQEILFQAPTSFYPAMWYVLRPATADESKKVAS